MSDHFPTLNNTAALPDTEIPPVVPAPEPFLPEYIAKAGKPLKKGETPAVRSDIIPYLGQVTDPEIGLDVNDLGLIYALEVDNKGNVTGEMTVTAPGCPFADTMLQSAADALAMAKGVGEVTIKLVWNPPWDFAMISDQAKLDLDLL